MALPTLPVRDESVAAGVQRNQLAGPIGPRVGLVTCPFLTRDRGRPAPRGSERERSELIRGKRIRRWRDGSSCWSSLSASGVRGRFWFRLSVAADQQKATERDEGDGFHELILGWMTVES